MSILPIKVFLFHSFKKSKKINDERMHLHLHACVPGCFSFLAYEWSGPASAAFSEGPGVEQCAVFIILMKSWLGAGSRITPCCSKSLFQNDCSKSHPVALLLETGVVGMN